MFSASTQNVNTGYRCDGLEFNWNEVKIDYDVDDSFVSVSIVRFNIDFIGLWIGFGFNCI